MKKKLINTLKQFIEITNDRRLAEHIRRNGSADGYEPFTAYRLGKDTKISLNTIYALSNDQDRIPSEKILKTIAEFYLAQPSELLSLVDDID
ncbi:hypothetical protein H6G54_05225 [Anabaena cylindrica FACHB-243]|uniref:HTH cro/C1-type domain-containing protein n=1 Tax=Anabaena cylindrica (strain ATCC 27899 / PCC 7122) TaxID=272123 RepID=K9ZNQ0_ANACC|nr:MULTISPECIES: helix-turn-helix transcriptional regulator [Anabaena]AFZ60821.1 hypothetical protein Anacy_5509 [Anabaena cylindrica PCC 7122]MBD2417121.1 hypothetical protein [Anabaena cylindrica FACHB-243]MBY5280817.1 hypothetical protein [Anabaena sp. CCAP 1446/1C]MBY5307093.1 hypothetical protein [Anabaena sp. CCAP 1446/1C]MCM2406822.1 helix-turn-helix transcriptional regulator [Anabaena sp. CCAP 1446/1C]